MKYSSSSIASTSLVNISPFSYTATKSRPTSIGSIPSLNNNDDISVDISSPSLTNTLSAIISIFPASTFVFNPKFPNSEIIGPGANGVGPALISISFGAICPAFAAAFDLFFCKIENNLKGFSFDKSNAGIPFMCSSNTSIPFLSFLRFCNAILINLFLVTNNSTESLNFFLIL